MKKNKDFLKWLKTRPQGRAFLLTNECDVDAFDYNDYVEDCIGNGIQPKGKDSIDYFRWCQNSTDISFDDDMENMKYSWAEKCGGYLITGALGLWWGHPTIEPVIVDSFKEVIRKVAVDDQCHINATYDTEGIHIIVSHHDGTNCFDVNILKKSTDRDLIQNYIDEKKLDLSKPYYKRFVQKIEDFLY